MYILFSVICQLFICICYSLGLYRLAVTILDRNTSRKRYLSFFAAFFLIQLIANVLLGSVYETAAAHGKITSFVWNILLFNCHTALLIVIILRTCHTGLAKTVTAAALSHFVVFTFTLIGSEFMAERVSADGSFFIFMLLSTVLPHLFGLGISLLTAGLLKKWEFHRYFDVFFTTPGKTAGTVAVSILLMNCHTLAELVFPVDTGASATVLCSAGFILLALFCLQFTAMYTAGREKIKAQEEIIGQQQAQLALLGELQQEMNAFRHDFANLMAGVSQQAMEGDLKGIRDFMQNTGNYFDERLGAEIKHLESVSNIKIHTLRSLITTKIMKSSELGISYTLETPKPVTEPGMRQEDLLRCLGILLDNAVEEAEKSSEKIVHIILFQGQGELYAAVSNTCAEKPDLVKMQENGYSSKGKNRGTGLGSLRKITGEYPNCMFGMRVDKELLIQELRIKF